MKQVKGALNTYCYRHHGVNDNVGFKNWNKKKSGGKAYLLRTEILMHKHAGKDIALDMHEESLETLLSSGTNHSLYKIKHGKHKHICHIPVYILAESRFKTSDSDSLMKPFENHLKG